MFRPGGGGNRGQQNQGTHNNPSVITGTFSFMKMFHPLLALYSIDRTMRGFGMVSSMAQAFTGALGSVWGAIGDTLLMPFQDELMKAVELSMQLLGWLSVNWPKSVQEIRDQVGRAIDAWKGGDIGAAIGGFIADFIKMSGLGKVAEIVGILLAVKGIHLILSGVLGILKSFVPFIRLIAVIAGVGATTEGIRLATQESLAPRKEYDPHLAARSGLAMGAGLGAAVTGATGVPLAGGVAAAVGAIAGVGASTVNQTISISTSIQNVDDFDRAMRHINSLMTGRVFSDMLTKAVTSGRP